jgi:SAM-dependent methyltransferase
VRGIPRLYIEENLGGQDKELRDGFYNGVVGTYYNFAMPLLSFPVRPLSLSWPHWIFFALSSVLCIGVAALGIQLVVMRELTDLSIPDVIVILALFGLIAFFYKHPYFFFLLLLAVPTRIALLFSGFMPKKSFRNVHSEVLEKLKLREGRLQILDISTGNCASLYRHGWMELQADYTAVDLSETMLMHGVNFMERAGVKVDFTLADAANLPFAPESFDVVLNYGAVNGMTDPALALREMSRVTKQGGVVLFLDEQLYDAASFFEREYFKRVLSSHDTVDRCPVEAIPTDLTNVQVYQVYEFYYLCVATKS